MDVGIDIFSYCYKCHYIPYIVVVFASVCISYLHTKSVNFHCVFIELTTSKSAHLIIHNTVKNWIQHFGVILKQTMWSLKICVIDKHILEVSTCEPFLYLTRAELS